MCTRLLPSLNRWPFEWPLSNSVCILVYRSGPSLDPWGTPLSFRKIVGSAPSMDTSAVRSSRKLLMIALGFKSGRVRNFSKTSSKYNIKKLSTKISIQLKKILLQKCSGVEIDPTGLVGLRRGPFFIPLERLRLAVQLGSNNPSSKIDICQISFSSSSNCVPIFRFPEKTLQSVLIRTKNNNFNV